MIDSNSSKIYKIPCHRVGYDSEYGGRYISGYSRIKEFDDKNQLAFCKDFGYWVDYEDIEETDLKSLPSTRHIELFLDDDTVKLIRSGKINIEDVYKKNILSAKIDADIV